MFNIFNQAAYGEQILVTAYGLLIASVVIGVLMHLRMLWNLRIALATLTCFIIGLASGYLIISGLAWFLTSLLLLLQIFRVFSLARIIKNRVQSEALRNKTLRSELVFGILVLTVMLFDQLGLSDTVSTDVWLMIFAGMQLVVATVYLLHSRWTRKSTEVTLPKKFHAANELPSITIAIPARNETQDLSDCLRSILRTDYPKMDVLVVDDCSQDNTSDIIKQFAHDGVRFIPGKIAPSSWLAKNYAYHQLLEEADGSYVIFCGTDVRFDRDSVRMLLEYMLYRKKKMASVLPIRLNGFNRSSLLQPMRYWRELAIPRIFDKTPPSLSTCWIIERTYLEKFGGFAAHKKTIRPERVIARAARGDHVYGFVRASTGLGISSVKSLPAQWQTAKRTRYPELKNRPENIFFASLMYGGVFFGAGALGVYALLTTSVALLTLALASMVILSRVQYLVGVMTNGKASISNMLLLPVSVLLELVVMNYSMWAYEFSEVIWKGRNVCLPVLRTNLKLPALADNSSEFNEVGNIDRKRRAVV